MEQKKQDIYASDFVEDLFDRMSSSYDRMNYVTSFGFSKLWRKQMLKNMDLNEAEVIVDLLSGMGECWTPLIRKAPKLKQVIALDFSQEMVKHAQERRKKFPKHTITILKENVFENSIPDASADALVCGFGLKTFSAEQIHQLAFEIERMLKINAPFSLIDVSVPKSFLLRLPYLFYLKRIVPLLGKLFLGNPNTYFMLGIYTERFANAQEVSKIFAQYGFELNYQEFFFGCASGISGIKKRT